MQTTRTNLPTASLDPNTAAICSSCRLSNRTFSTLSFQLLYLCPSNIDAPWLGLDQGGGRGLGGGGFGRTPPLLPWSPQLNGTNKIFTLAVVSQDPNFCP